MKEKIIELIDVLDEIKKRKGIEMKLMLLELNKFKLKFMSKEFKKKYL
jgi:hypothetical protein